MAGRVAIPPMTEEGNRAVLPLGFVRGLLDTIEKPLMVAERNGNLLLINTRAKQFLESHGHPTTPGLNLFKDLLKTDARKIFDEFEKGEHDLEHPIRSEEHTSELQSPDHLVCRLLLEKKKKKTTMKRTESIHGTLCRME